MVFLDQSLVLIVLHLLLPISNTHSLHSSFLLNDLYPQEFLHSSILFRDGIFLLRLFLMDWYWIHSQERFMELQPMSNQSLPIQSMQRMEVDLFLFRFQLRSFHLSSHILKPISSLVKDYPSLSLPISPKSLLSPLSQDHFLLVYLSIHQLESSLDLLLNYSLLNQSQSKQWVEQQLKLLFFHSLLSLLSLHSHILGLLML